MSVIVGWLYILKPLSGQSWQAGWHTVPSASVRTISVPQHSLRLCTVTAQSFWAVISLRILHLWLAAPGPLLDMCLYISCILKLAIWLIFTLPYPSFSSSVFCRIDKIILSGNWYVESLSSGFVQRVWVCSSYFTVNFTQILAASM